MSYFQTIVKLESILKPDPFLFALFRKNKKRYSEVVRSVVDFYPLDDNLRILDFGSGNPFVVFILLDLGYDVTGYEPFIDVHSERCIELLGLKDRILVKNSGSIYFDIILLVDVIEHVPILSSLFSDIDEFTHSSTTLVISTPNVFRMEMWFLFLTRKQGHPQSIQSFVRNPDLYSNHQREFTMAELIYTLDYFGFKKIVHNRCVDTLPSMKDLHFYHKQLGLPIHRRSIFQPVFSLLKFIFPTALSNNLFLIVTKR